MMCLRCLCVDFSHKPFDDSFCLGQNDSPVITINERISKLKISRNYSEIRENVNCKL